MRTGLTWHSMGLSALSASSAGFVGCCKAKDNDWTLLGMLSSDAACLSLLLRCIPFWFLHAGYVYLLDYIVLVVLLTSS